MRPPRCLVLVALLLPVLHARAEPFAMRLGAWEISAMQSGLREPVVDRACITKPDLLPFVHGPDTIEDDPCKASAPVQSTKRRWSVSLQCQDGSQLHAEFLSDSAERFSGTLVRIGGQRTLTQRVEYKGRWLGGTCGAIRP